MNQMLVITKIGPNAIAAIKSVRFLTGIGLKEAKNVIDLVREGTPQEIDYARCGATIEQARDEMNASGATVEIRSDDPLAITREEQAVLDAARDLTALDLIRESWWPDSRVTAEQALADKLLARFRRAAEALPADPPEEP